MTVAPKLMGGTPLTSGTVQVFYSAITYADAATRRLANFLSPDERSRAARLRIPAKRDEFELSRGLLRMLLGHFLDRAPQEITFATGPHGKPHVVGTPLYFNVSHAAGATLIAITPSHPIGVDVEQIDETIACLGMAKTYFTPQESAELLAVPEGDRLLAFYRGWTRKEALLKATGEGIAAGLTKTTVPLRETKTPLTVQPWVLHDLPLPPTHAACLAVPCAPPMVWNLKQIQASKDGSSFFLAEYP